MNAYACQRIVAYGVECFLAQRARAALRAISVFRLEDRLSARALPPFEAPSADNACACGFLPSAGLRGSPMACSTTPRAVWLKSTRLLPLGVLARAGIPVNMLVFLAIRQRAFMVKIIRTEKEPILIRPFGSDRLELRIRKFADFGTRFVHLRAKEARKLAVALLLVAEKLSESE